MRLYKAAEWQALLRSTLLQNIVFLYGTTLVSYALPLVTLPYLARVLGTTSYGNLAFAQAFGGYILLLVEYGFVFSATRELSRHRDLPYHRAQMLAGVTGAKAVLAFIGIVSALIAYYVIPIFRALPMLLAASTFWAIAQASSMLWYYQGLEQLRFASTLDVVSKTISTGLIFFFVRSPADAWLALFLPGLGALFSTAVATGVAYRETPFHRPTIALSVRTLREGWTMFLYRGAVSFYTIGNTVILGVMASPQHVAYFAGGERICKVFIGLLYPISQALYPRLNYLVAHQRALAHALARRTMIFMFLAGTAIGIGEFLFAPLLVQIFLGPGYEPAVQVVRIMSLLPPLIALSSFLGLQWMVPLGMDRAFNAVIMLSGLLNLTLAITLASRFSYVGMAFSVVAAEFVGATAMFIYLRAQRKDPLSPFSGY